MRTVRWLFLRALGGVWWIAFRSLRAQVRGLFGARGIAPMQPFLDELRRALGRRALIDAPSLFYRDASDQALERWCRVGERAGLALLFDVRPRAAAALAWAVYLSFVVGGGEFLAFQWDALLLESGLHAALIAPRGRHPGLGDDDARAQSLALRWLAFRLPFESGLAKLQSRDPTWRCGTACRYHFETQPLPTALAWHANRLPPRLQRLATNATLALELAAPFLVLSRRTRRASFALLALLQAAIAATGNYGFFNLLALADALWLLDDDALRFIPLRRPPIRKQPIYRRASALASAALALVSAATLVARVRQKRLRPSLARAARALAPLRSVNRYGLFAVMTTERPEIVVEGSRDGVEWRAYPFRWKPGDLRQRPPLVAPHMPRLDWQMWFAALSSPPRWFASFLGRLLEGSPDVLALLGGNPFPGAPPRYVRALLYRYRMTDRRERRSTGNCWRRELVGVYFPPSSLV